MKKPIIAVLVFMLFLISCGTNTKITGSWQAEEGKTYNFDKIGVIGITANADNRRIVEDKIEVRLAENGISAIGGVDFLPPNANKDNISLEVLKGFLISEKVDAVMTVSVLRVNDSKQYTSGSYYYVPWTTTYFGDYYGQMNNYLYAPGYTTVNTTVFLESNLYEFPGGELVWSAQTKSSDVTDIEKASESLARALVADLTKRKVIE